MRKPPRLYVGDTIGIVSPAAAVEDAKLKRGVAVLEKAGFSVRIGTRALYRDRFFAGSDEDRAAELIEMLHDPGISAIFCSRAGYGSGRLVPLLAREDIRDISKIFIGYSDATALLNLFVQETRMVCFHGPVVAGEFASGPSEDSLLHLFGLLTVGQGLEHLSYPTTLRGGIGEGNLVGGCLSILTATLGTPFAFSPGKAILFLEDVGEAPYRVDRMLTQLKQAGIFEELAGVVLGEMNGCRGKDEDPTLLLSVVSDIFADYSYPVGFGLPAGHGRENFTLPLGTRVRLDGERNTLEFLETAVA